MYGHSEEKRPHPEEVVQRRPGQTVPNLPSKRGANRGYPLPDVANLTLVCAQARSSAPTSAWCKRVVRECPFLLPFPSETGKALMLHLHKAGHDEG